MEIRNNAEALKAFLGVLRSGVGARHRRVRGNESGGRRPHLPVTRPH